MILMIILGFAAGVTNVIARNINSLLANDIGVIEGTLWNYITGIALSIVFFLISGEILAFGKVSLGFGAVHLMAYTGGLLGIAVVTLSNFVTPKISAFYLTLIMLIGQIFTGVIIDYVTSGLLSKGKIIGGVLVVLGLAFNLYIDSTEPQTSES